MSKQHDAIFADYVNALAEAKKIADAWWDALVDAARAGKKTRATAEAAVRSRWQCGPASHPRVLAAIRAAFFACVAANENADPDDDDYEEPDPHYFVTEKLMDGENDELGEFIADLTYWPIGIDDDGVEV